MTDLGVKQNGRSSRYWLLDRGWWLINIEFQSPTHTLGSYLNVGLQHLWDDHHAGQFFEYSFRVDIPDYGAQVSLVGSEAEVYAQAEAIGQAARGRVIDWLNQFPNDKSHLVWLSDQRNTPANRENAAMALGMLGKHKKAGALLSSYAEAIDLTWDARGFWREHQQRAFALAAKASNPGAFDDEVFLRIAHKRDELKLSATDNDTRPRVTHKLGSYRPFRRPADR